MSNDPVSLHFQAIRQHFARLQQEDAVAWTEIEVVLEDLHTIYEEMQTNLETAIVIEQQQLQHYYDLFQAAPIAYLVTDANGGILEANQAIAHLLNVPHPYLTGKPLVLYVAADDRSKFRTRLNQLAQNGDQHVWQLNLCPRGGETFAAHLQVAVSRTREGQVERLKVGIFDLSQARGLISSASEVASPGELSKAPDHTLAPPPVSDSTQAMPVSPLPYSLDGLRVLVVDDEAGICKFITALLESHGIGVKAVTNSTAALEEIERFQPDVLLSDIRMPGGDGYDLIRQIRALEARQGRHIPAAAITAYLDEDREKALSAGYEAYWYKLSQPTELVEMVAQLAERATKDQS